MYKARYPSNHHSHLLGFGLLSKWTNAAERKVTQLYLVLAGSSIGEISLRRYLADASRVSMIIIIFTSTVRHGAARQIWPPKCKRAAQLIKVAIIKRANLLRRY